MIYLGGPEEFLLRSPQILAEAVTHRLHRHERNTAGAVVAVREMDRLYRERLIERVVRGGYNILDRMRRHGREHQLLLRERSLDVLRARCERTSYKKYDRQSFVHFDRFLLSLPRAGPDCPARMEINIINNRFSQTTASLS